MTAEPGPTPVETGASQKGNDRANGTFRTRVDGAGDIGEYLADLSRRRQLPVAYLAAYVEGLRRRREAAWRLPPMSDGRRDPLYPRNGAA